MAESVEFAGLNERQAKCVMLLAEGRKASEIRKELEVPTSTWYVWTGKPEFQEAIESLQRSMLRDLRSRLHHAGEPAIACLLMAVSESSWTVTEGGGLSGIPASAVAAARDILDRIGLVALAGAGEERPTEVTVHLHTETVTASTDG